MRSFRCPTCAQLVFFENSTCLRCGQELGYDPLRHDLVAADTEPRCANAAIAACNWIPSRAGAPCLSCRLTRTRPADSDTEAMAAFAATEAAKRRLVAQLFELGLPLRSWADRDGGLAYDLLSSRDAAVVIGHQDGVVTIDLAESDDPHREQVRQEMGEPYRTMLGHLRHETGHYYWTVLVEGTPHLQRFRELFGDERASYADAVDRHYAQGPPADWPDAHVSAYATMHPWEDWAETFAHYLHIRDTLQTAGEHGIRVEAPEASLSADPGDVDADAEPFEEILAAWLPLTYALNAVNRAMGRDDLYPFVLPPPVVEKLAWVHRLCTAPGS
ncbi:MAG: putative zinc-binding metallopeptidase [Pseudonocardia sp.]